MRKDKNNKFFLMKKITTGMIISIIIISAIFIYNNTILPGEFFLYETVPFYNYDSNNMISQIFKIVPSTNENDTLDNNLTAEVFSQNDSADTDIITKIEILESDETPTSEFKASDADIIGTNNVIYQPETQNIENNFNTEILSSHNIEDLRKLEYITSKFYTVEPETELIAQNVDIDEFLAMNLKIDKNTQNPKVLIFQTHSTESFAGSNSDNMYEGIVGVGEELKKILYEKYGIVAIHNTSRFDIVDGRSQILGSYERMAPVIEKILKDNPSIEIVIDLHRDAVNDETTKFLTYVDGKPTAKIMFVNGLSLLKENNKLRTLDYIPNPNQKANLAFSFNMQVKANELYPGLTRRLYIKPYRYSLYMKPKSLLVEIGNQNNTFEEAKNAVNLLADVLAEVVLP